MRCAACGSGALRPHLRVGPAEGEALVPTTDSYGRALSHLVRCSACGHAQVGELPSDDDLGRAYAAAEDPSYAREEAGQRRNAVAALDRIERHVPRGALLDVGCWTGMLVAEAARRGWSACGVEPSRAAAAAARERGVTVVEGGIEAVPEATGPLDAVVLADVLEHLPRPVDALRRVHGLLRPGGVAYLALPDAGSRLARLLGARWWSVLPTHLHYFTGESLGRALARAGLRLEWSDTAPKAFSVGYYAARLSGYSPVLARAAGAAVRSAGLSDRLVIPDLRDRIAAVARRA